MKLLKIFVTAISFMAFSVAAYATPATATLSIDGFVDYDVAGDGASPLDGIYGDGDWTYSGEFNFSTSVTGTPPAFSENANWYLSGDGQYSLTVGGTTTSDSDAFGPISLGYGSVDDLFGAAITGYGDILPALGGLLTSATPSLTDIILALNGILDPSLAAALPLDMSITDISDHIFFALLGPNTVGFVSDLGLTIGGVAPREASARFSGNLSLTAVPEPSGLGLLGLGLIGVVLVRRKRMAA